MHGPNCIPGPFYTLTYCKDSPPPPRNHKNDPLDEKVFNQENGAFWLKPGIKTEERFLSFDNGHRFARVFTVHLHHPWGTNQLIVRFGHEIKQLPANTTAEPATMQATGNKYEVKLQVAGETKVYNVHTRT